MGDKRVTDKVTAQALAIMSMIAVTGEFPSQQIGRLSGGHSYKEKVLTDLKHRNLIHTIYRDSLRGLRLTGKAKDLLLSDNPARFSFALAGDSDTNKLRSQIPRRLRLHRIAETYVTMANANVAIFRDKKPDVFYVEDGGEDCTPPVTAPAFYDSREIKETGADATAIRGSRATGILLTENTAFVVYNSGGSLMKWEYKSEMRMQASMKMLLCRHRLSSQYEPDSVEGLMLGDSMELAYQLLSSTGSIKRNYFVLDGNYDSFHYITNDRNGEIVLRLLCSVERMNELRGILSEDLSPREPGSLVENDAIDEDGTPVLFGYTTDMPRIARFNSALQLHERSGTLICFDFQADALSRYCCDNVRIQSIDIQKLERRFFP